MFDTALPLPLYADLSGDPLDNGYLYFGIPNANPETSPLQVTWDLEGTQPAAQPIRTRNGFAVRNGSPAKLHASGSYSLTVRNARRELVLYAAAVTPANTFQQSLTGAVLRTYVEKLTEFLSVKDFGAVGDGVTSDQAAVTAAIAAAASSGKRLYWPAGTYVTTASIPSFHTVKHFGAGVVKRSTDSFRVDITSADTNIIYISPAGGAAADGLSASQPIDTLTNAWAVLANYGPHMRGKWKIVHAAGTYSGYHRVPYQLSSEKLVEISGPDVGGHPNVPTAIYDNAGAASIVVSCINGGMKIKVKDVKLKGCETAAISMTRGLLYCENVHTEDCQTGISCAEGSLIVSGGMHTTTAGYLTGFARIQSIFNNKHTIGYSYDENTGNVTQAANIAAAPQLIAGNNSGRGIYCAESATGHAYALVQGWSKGAELISRSRINLDSSDFRFCQTAVEVEAHCDFGGTPVFNKGGGTENTVSVRHIHGGISYTAYPSPGSAVEYRVGQDTNPAGSPLTGVTTLQQIGGTLYTLTGQDFDEGGSSLRMVIVGTMTGTAGTKTLSMRIGGVNAGGVTFNASATGVFHAEITMRQIASASQFTTGWGIAGAGGLAAVADAGHGAVAIDIADGVSKAVTLAGQLGNGADSIDADLIEIFRTN